MVLGHSGFPFTHFIYLFHMAIFFIASGYCWDCKNSETVSSVFKYTVRKIRTLYIPYVVCNGIFLILNNLFIRIGIYTTDPYFLELVGDDYSHSLATALNAKGFLINLIKILTFYSGTQLGGATWFLRTLFFVSVGNCIYEFLIMKLHRINRMTAIMALSLVCCIIYELHNSGAIIIPSTIVLTFIISYITFAVGIFIRWANIWRNGTPWYIAIISICILLVCNHFGSIGMDKGEVTNAIFFIIVSLAGWYTIMFVSEKIEFTKISKCIAYLGKHTMPIVLLHFLCFKIVTYLYLMLSGQNLILLAYFPSLETEKYLWIIYSVVGVVAPILLYMFYERIKFRFWGRRI